MRYESDLHILAVVSAFFVISIVLLQAAAHTGWRLRDQSRPVHDGPVSRFVSVILHAKVLPRLSYVAIAAALGAYAILIVVDTASLSRDIRALVVNAGCANSFTGRPGADAARRVASAVAKRFEPVLVSEHLAWSTHDGAFFNDLLPLPYTSETLGRVADHIDEAQNALRRTILLENPSTYVVFAESTMSETDFLREIARRTGCGLLLDINNVFVSATNHGRDPQRYLADFPLSAVGEVHLAGYAEDEDDLTTAGPAPAWPALGAIPPALARPAANQASAAAAMQIAA